MAQRHDDTAEQAPGLPGSSAPLLPRSFAPRSAFRLVVALLLVGAVFRLSLLGSRSLWFDEAFTVILSEKTLTDIWQFPQKPGDDPHPRLYKTILHYWLPAVGDSEMAVRLVTALSSMLNVALIWALGRRLFGRPVGLAAAALLAVAPLEVWYAQEARMYMLIATCGLAFAVFLTMRSWAALPGLLLSLVIGLYIDLPMVPLSLGLSALFVVDWWQRGREPRRLLVWAAAVAGAWLLYLPILPYLTFTFGELNRIFVFREARAALGLPDFAPGHYVLALLVITGLVGIAAALAQRLLRRPGVRAWVGPLVIVGFALLTATFPVPRLFAVERVLLTGWPYVVLLVAWLLAADGRLWRRALGPVLVISAVAAAVALFVPKDDWRGAVAHINSHAAASDALLIDPGWNSAATSYYDIAIPVIKSRSRELPGVAGDVWLIAERFPGLAVPSSPSEAWLDENARLLETRPFYRLEVRRYRP